MGYDIKDVYRLYYESLKFKYGPYDYLYEEFKKLTKQELNSVRADVVSDMEIVNLSPLVYSSIALTFGIVSIALNFGINSPSITDDKYQWVNVAFTVFLWGVIIYSVFRTGRISQGFLGKQRDRVKINRYILCVIEDIEKESV